MYFGRRRRLHVRKLEPGMQLCEHIRGRFGKILVAEGEILTLKHVEQLRRWEARPGEGRLSLYTREVWTRAALGSGRERPLCDEDPYAAVSVQKWYKTNRR